MFISVVANIAPADVAEMCNAFHAGNLELARKLHYKALPLAVDLFIETKSHSCEDCAPTDGQTQWEIAVAARTDGPCESRILAQYVGGNGIDLTRYFTKKNYPLPIMCLARSGVGFSWDWCALNFRRSVKGSHCETGDKRLLQ